jgi:hypothetical protein
MLKINIRPNHGSKEKIIENFCISLKLAVTKQIISEETKNLEKI